MPLSDFRTVDGAMLHSWNTPPSALRKRTGRAATTANFWDSLAILPTLRDASLSIHQLPVTWILRLITSGGEIQAFLARISDCSMSQIPAIGRPLQKCFQVKNVQSLKCQESGCGSANNRDDCAAWLFFSQLPSSTNHSFKPI